MKYLYHIAIKEDWQRAKSNNTYTNSTLGKSLDNVGYIHLSYAHQVKLVADFIYKGMSGLVLLKIDPSKLTSRVVVEDVEGTDEKFPHLYGPLNLDAVIDISEFIPSGNGTFDIVSE